MYTRICFLWCLIAVLVQSSTKQQLATFYSKFGGRDAIPSGTADGLEAVLYGIDDFMLGNINTAKARVDSIFSRIASQGSTYKVLQNPPNMPGWGMGSPPVYKSLKMLKQVLDFAATKQISYNTSLQQRPRFTIVVAVAMCASGQRALNLQLTQFEQVNLKINPLLQANNYAGLRSSLQMFRLYLWAIAKGAFTVDIVIKEISDCVTVSNKLVGESMWMGVLGGDLASYKRNTLDKRTQEADMVLLVYPSVRPKTAQFNDKTIITGGAVGGQRTLFIIGEDTKFIYKTPSLGSGELTDVERRMLDGWYQHEVFHNLYNKFSQFKLEAKVHQWFERELWPADFVKGEFLEADYFYESVNKRFIPLLNPSLGLSLLTSLPTLQFVQQNWASISPYVAGSYMKLPANSGWDQVVITKTGTNTWVWKNQAGASFNLEWGSQGLVAPKSPYGLQIISLNFRRNSLGFFIPTGIPSITFNGQTYTKRTATSQAVLASATPDTYSPPTSSPPSTVLTLDWLGVMSCVVVALVCSSLLVVVTLFTWKNYKNRSTNMADRP